MAVVDTLGLFKLLGGDLLHKLVRQPLHLLVLLPLAAEPRRCLLARRQLPQILPHLHVFPGRPPLLRRVLLHVPLVGSEAEEPGRQQGVHLLPHVHPLHDGLVADAA